MSEYPTEDCVMPHEVADYQRAGTVPDDLLPHLQICPACRALLETAKWAYERRLGTKGD